MLSQSEYQTLACQWALPEAGRAYVDLTRSSEPARLVGSPGFRNTPIRIASQKMGRTIQAESDTVEGAFARLCEYDRGIPEYWDQPPEVPLVIINKRGHRQRTPYTADYLVLRPQGPAVIECKSLLGVQQLLAERPHDWLALNGGYRYRPAHEYFASIGLPHEVWVPDDHSVLRSSNIDLLLATRRLPSSADEGKWCTRIRTYLVNTPIASIAELCRELKLPDASTLLRGIDEGWLYTPLDRYLLSRPHDALLALTQEHFDLGFEALSLCRVTPLSGAIAAQMSVPCAAHAMIMLQRQQELAGTRSPTRSARTLRRHRAKLRAMSGDVRALLPQRRWGNRGLRLSLIHEEFIKVSINEFHAKATAPTAVASHLDYENAFVDAKATGFFAAHEVPVSLNTWLIRIRRLGAEVLARSRGGNRAANAAAEPVDRQYSSAPATRPFQIGHADHYLGDRELTLRCSGKRKLTRKPWISVLRDDYTKEILAIAIGFRSPSRKVLAELLRDCVRRHGRLPEMITSDCGSDFQSVFYEAALALLGVHKKDRPSAAPRFGGGLERLFGTIKTAILWRRAGSTRNDARGRAVSPSHRAHRLAEQDLIDFHHELESAVFGQLNVHLRGENLNAPEVAMQEGLAMFPMSGVPVEYDHSFMVATSVDAPEKVYTVDPSRGINPCGAWYWHPALARVANTRVEVRLDPWDEDMVYAMVQDEWVCCRARGTLYAENKDLVAMMSRAVLRMDGRQELAEAQHEGDLSLARHLATRERMSPPDTSNDAQQPSEDAVDAMSTDTDEISAISVHWSP